MASQIRITLPDSQYDLLSAYALDHHLKLSEAAAELITRHLPRPASSNDGAAFTFIDLFAGIGGMRIAYTRAGGKCVYSNEWNKFRPMQRISASCLKAILQKSMPPPSPITMCW